MSGTEPSRSACVNCYPEPWRGDGEFSVDEHAVDLTAFIRQIASEPVHLIGHSRGATVSLYAARLAPDLIRTLTLAEGGDGMQAFAPEEPGLRDLRDRVVQTVTPILASGDVDGALAPYLEFANGPGSWEKLPPSVKQWFRDNAWTLAAGWRYAPSAFSCADASALDMPALLLRGDSSPPLFGAILDRLGPCLSRAERAVISNSSHGMSRTNPAEFNATVMGFMSRH